MELEIIKKKDWEVLLSNLDNPSQLRIINRDDLFNRTKDHWKNRKAFNNAWGYLEKKLEANGTLEKRERITQQISTIIQRNQMDIIRTADNFISSDSHVGNNININNSKKTKLGYLIMHHKKKIRSLKTQVQKLLKTNANLTKELKEATQIAEQRMKTIQDVIRKAQELDSILAPYTNNIRLIPDKISNMLNDKNETNTNTAYKSKLLKFCRHYQTMFPDMILNYRNVQKCIQAITTTKSSLTSMYSLIQRFLETQFDFDIGDVPKKMIRRAARKEKDALPLETYDATSIYQYIKESDNPIDIAIKLIFQTGMRPIEVSKIQANHCRKTVDNQYEISLPREITKTKANYRWKVSNDILINYIDTNQEQVKIFEGVKYKKLSDRFKGVAKRFSNKKYTLYSIRKHCANYAFRQHVENSFKNFLGHSASRQTLQNYVGNRVIHIPTIRDYT